LRRIDDLSLDDLESVRVGEVYPSRKNMVFRVSLDGEIVIVKVYREGCGRAEREFSVLERASEKGLLVPRPIGLRDFGILMEFVEGDNAGAVFDSLWEEDPNSPDAVLRRADFVHAVSAWLAGFHRAFAFSFCRGDSILKNFIVGPKGLTGIDFEEAVEGDPLNDLGQTCSYVLSTDPMFTDAKFQCAKDIFAGYESLAGTDRSEELSSKVAESLRYYSRFRRDGETLRAWASRIETENLLR
jgi:tRNA A-37 threonylcarbamoyl transferase component Bud32